MTSKERAAMQQALEALESYSKSDYIKKQHPKRRANGEKAITALREALAEPQITTPDVCGEVCERAKLCYGCSKDLDETNAKLSDSAYKALQIAGLALMEISCPMQDDNLLWWQLRAREAQKHIDKQLTNAAPVRTKDLTDDEIRQTFIEANGGKVSLLIAIDVDFARAVIAADREKNK